MTMMTADFDLVTAISNTKHAISKQGLKDISDEVILQIAMKMYYVEVYKMAHVITSGHPSALEKIAMEIESIASNSD